MTHTFEELHKMTVANLREIAEGIEHEQLQGYSTMHKDKLVPALCNALGIEDHVHHEVVGIDKASLKSKIKTLKAKRDEALEAKDSKALKKVRRHIHSLKRRLHKATV